MPQANRKLRVLHVGPLPPPIGGIGNNVARFLRSDVTRRCDVHHVRADLLRKHRTAGPARTLVKLANAVALAAAVVAGLLRHPDLVHIRTSSRGPFYENSVLVHLARLARRPVLLHVHGGAFKIFHHRRAGKLSGWWIRRTLRAATRVIVLADNLRDDFLDMGVPADRIAVVPNAIDAPDEAQVPDRTGRAGPLTVLFLNRVHYVKGVGELIEAARLLRDRGVDVRIRIVGPAEMRADQLPGQIARLDLDGMVELHGPIGGSAIADAYRDADIYVLPSWFEGMPLGLLEAMSFALPCIATPVGGVGAVVRDGENGLLVERRDPEALADAIGRLAGDGDLRRRLGKQARHDILQRFTWSERERQLVALYREAAGRSNDD